MTSKAEIYAQKLMTNTDTSKGRTKLALEAGYAPGHARNPAKIESSYKFQQFIATACPDNMIKSKLLEALNCTKPVLNQTGQILAEVPDNTNRLKALELTCKLRNLFPKDVAETNANNLSAWLNGIKLQRESNKLANESAVNVTPSNQQ